MINILFLCHGNICRSPMAEYICKQLSGERDLHIESMAVTGEELGNPIYPAAADTLRRRGVPFGNHRARKITRADYDRFDYLLVMEEYNLPRLMRIIGQDDGQKVHRLLDFTDTPGDIEDPWYSRRFDRVFDQIKAGCEGLLADIDKKV